MSRTPASPMNGIACMVGASALIIMNNAVMKWLTGTVPVGELLFVRGTLILIGVVALAGRGGGLERLRIRSFRDQAIRGALTVVSTFLIIHGLRLLPLADVTAITFAGPFFITAMAAYVLGEKVGWRRWLAVAVGFAGILLMTKPTGGAWRWEVTLPLGVALFGAIRDILTRRISTTETSQAMLFWTIAAVAVSGLATWPLGWVALGWPQVGLLALAAVLFGGAHYLAIESFRLAEAALVAPFKYSEMVWAVLIGAAAFGALPDGWIVGGSALVVGSGLYILRAESRRRRAAAG